MPALLDSRMERTARRALAITALGVFGCTGTLVEDDAGTRRDALGLDADESAADALPSDAGGSREDTPVATDAASAGSGCAAHDYLFCEDFESASPGTLPEGWSVAFGWQDEDTEPAVSELSAHGGTRALRSALAIDGQRRAEHSLASLGEHRGVHWGRVFYRVEAPAYVPTSGVVHNTMLALIGGGEARVVDTVIGGSGAHQFLYNIPDDSCCAGSSYDYRTYDGDWHCAEWQVDWTTQSYRFFIDGAEVTSIALDRGAGTTGAAMDEFDRVALGWRNYQMPPTPYDSFFDDLAFDDTRVGCE
ncbi:MAG: hypothetical protein J0L92_05685 [Deltaproteobacteria bacterium]|nr:hypothetical protein [Deltaproteobacteria bacterium]